MVFVKIYIFDVEHGFCSAIIDSNGNLIIIDCGRKSGFSPIREVASQLSLSLSNINIGLFVLTHPHGDHIEDVDNLLLCNLRNKYANSLSNYEDNEIKSGNSELGYKNLLKFEKATSSFSHAAYSPPNWLFNLDLFGLTVERARLIDSNSVINNSSRIVVLNFYNKKIIYLGDIQKSGIESLLYDSRFIDASKSPTVIVTPHHGHRSSYNGDLYEKIGKPIFNVCSLEQGDPHIAGEYSTEQTSIGTTLFGKYRRMLSTRSDGTIVFTLMPQKWTVDFIEFKDNERNYLRAY